jgi:hypothetical protein
VEAAPSRIRHEQPLATEPSSSAPRPRTRAARRPAAGPGPRAKPKSVYDLGAIQADARWLPPSAS